MTKFPEDANLKYYLLRIYRDTKRWDELEEYLAVGNFYGVDRSDYFAALASKYFDDKQWKFAAKHYINAGNAGVDALIYHELHYRS